MDKTLIFFTSLFVAGLTLSKEVTRLEDGGSFVGADSNEVKMEVDDDEDDDDDDDDDSCVGGCIGGIFGCI